MAFQRATWHSGLTYEQTCRNCNTRVTYQDDKLDFRPWYADGFVYCPICNTPLRHNEGYAINRPAEPVHVDITGTEPIVTEAKPSDAKFCTGCGREYQPGENFCPVCGRKR